MTRLRTTSTRDALVAELRRRILSADLAPGTALTEVGLAEEYGVARPTVRSALQELSGLRLVRHGEARSPTVPALTEADARDLLFVREPLELAAVTEIATRRLPVPEPRRRLDELAALPAQASWADRVSAHTRFHQALVDAAGSVRLTRMYPPLQDEMQLCLAQLHPAYPDPAALAAEHRVLLDAVSSGDPERARRSMHDHLVAAVDAFGALT